MTHGSFKLRMALWSVLLSGAVLLAMGLLFLSILQKISHERIDREIRALADPQVRRLFAPDHWPRFDSLLRSLYGEEETQQFIMKIQDRNGEILYISSPWPAELTDRSLPSLGPLEEAAPPPPALVSEPSRGLPRAAHLRQPSFATHQAAGIAWRIAVMGNEQYTMVFGMNLTDVQEDLLRYRNTFLISVPVALLLLLATGWLLARQALRPVEVIAHTTEGITAQRLAKRVPRTGAAREFQRLIDVINDMLERLDRSFQQATRFSADAAHELKTPLTILQGQLEAALQKAPDDSPEQRTYTELLEEVQRLKAIVHKLLLVAQADAGQLPVSMTRVNLSSLVTAASEDIRVIAPHLSLQAEIAPNIWVRADPDLLNQLLRNLTSNAVKFNRPEGAISLQLMADADGVRLTIANTGSTIPPEERDRIFDRFYRADKSRGRHVDGVGLGLSLAREIARAHRGDLALRDDRAGWTTFVLTLPLCAGDTA